MTVLIFSTQKCPVLQPFRIRDSRAPIRDCFQSRDREEAVISRATRVLRAAAVFRAATVREPSFRKRLGRFQSYDCFQSRDRQGAVISQVTRASMFQVSNMLTILNREVIVCERCPRLRKYCAQVAAERRRAYRDWEYWGRPVPSFGDPKAKLLIIGLAPGAHGANRTGRMFTGDRSGEFLYRALYETGFASQPESTSRDDGLQLTDAYISAAVRCAPPDNKPSRDEFRNCRSFLERELDALSRLQVVVALGKLAFDAYLGILRDRGVIQRRSAYTFAHDREHPIAPNSPTLISSYHPSQQNTSTGRLTREMLHAVFARVRDLVK
jgi:uracil-DNA glycosylase